MSCPSIFLKREYFCFRFTFILSFLHHTYVHFFLYGFHFLHFLTLFCSILQTKFYFKKMKKKNTLEPLRWQVKSFYCITYRTTELNLSRIVSCLYSISSIFHFLYFYFSLLSFVLCLLFSYWFSFISFLIFFISLFHFVLFLYIRIYSYIIFLYLLQWKLSAKQKKIEGCCCCWWNWRIWTSAKKSFSAMKRREENIFHNVIITNKTKQHLAEEKK